MTDRSGRVALLGLEGSGKAVLTFQQVEETAESG